MHTAVFAFTVGVPALLIAYQPKARGMMEMFGFGGFCFDIDKVTVQELMDRMTIILSNLDQFKESVVERQGAFTGELERLEVFLKETR
jgi:polysaccharide pyruvyl transferase WcaK-like protein